MLRGFFEAWERKQVKKIIIIIAIIGLVGCTRGHEFNVDEMVAAPDAAIVYFYRLSAYKGMFQSFSVIVDGNEIGTLDNGAYFKHIISPGDYKIHSDTSALVAIDRISTFTFEAGKTYFLRCFIDLGMWVSSIRFVIVHEEEALPEIQKTSLQ